MNSKIKFNNCLDCNEELSLWAKYNGTGYCVKCSKKGERNPNFGNKHEFSNKTKQKMSLAKKGEKNSSYKDGRTLKTYYCLDCDEEISNHIAKRCKSCSCKERYEDPTKVPFYKHGLTIKPNYCIEIDCNKKIDYRAIRCSRCELKNPLRYKNIFKKNKNLPNIPEQILQYIIDIFIGNYVYVGDGRYWIECFNPDFIDIKNKKIIEVYGDYWHNLSSSKKRDKKRLKIYEEVGYKTLIVWEHELKKSFRVLVNKIRMFTNEKNIVA